MFAGNWSRFFMGMQIAASWSVFQSDEIAITDEFNVIGTIPQWSRLVEFLDKPTVVAIFVRISRNLLLLSSNSGRIQVHMRMEVTTTSNTVLQGQQ